MTHTIPGALQLRPMILEDASDVLALHKQVFTSPWSIVGFRYEVEENELAAYHVLRDEVLQPPALIGFVGHWLMAGEAHISTIAVQPERLRQGWGELLLLVTLRYACRQGAQLATLEVRPSNEAARTLYAKYQFEVVGRRQRYYRDNQEDALIMTVPALSPTYAGFLDRRWTAVLARIT